MSQPAGPGLRLDDLLERMAAPQLIRIAGRYAPGREARAMQRARTVISEALDDPQALRALVDDLTPLERYALGEVRRGGGRINGWQLLAGARARGLSVSRPVRVELYRHYPPARFDGAEVIWTLLADGLLLPTSLPNPFMESYGAGLDVGSPDLSADDRLLAALPETPPLPVRLGFPPAAAPPGSDPQLAQLHLLEVLRGVQAAGGLPYTRQGEYNRSALKRLARTVPAVPELELWLEVAVRCGVLVASESGVQPAPDALSGRVFRQDAAALLRKLARLYPALTAPLDEAGYALAHLSGLRSALMAVLTALPGPTTLSALAMALETVTPPVLRAPSWKGKADAWHGWLRHALSGPLHTLGLVALGSGEATDLVVAAAPALSGADAAVLPGPAWIVQPNFELLVYPAQLNGERLRLLSAAQALRFDRHSASYRLTRESVYAALEAGLTLETLLEGLSRASATALPAGVRSTLEGWAARRERMVLHTGVTLLEFPDTAERDAYRERRGGTAIGAALLLPPSPVTPAGAAVVRYDRPPARSLQVLPDGRLQRRGELDFLARRWLAALAERDGDTYTLRPAAPGQLPGAVVRELEARVEGELPAVLRLQLGVWSGVQPPPVLASATLLQHPQAAELAQYPQLADHLVGPLGPGLLLVQAGQEEALRAALAQLGLGPAATLSATPAASGGAADYEFPDDTRQKRALIERAIELGSNLQLMYQTETYHGWYGESRPGRTRQELVRPLQVVREGSTPYLLARRLPDGEDERIRIGYVLGLALR
ncbi:helicase-associated domain-containing protein [Deinococcus sonorensis]|uniref:Helicase-associated domain-containing protein n=2 Tax=Deinococcus sonorensis TaxID=309891 RepID=A0AAU7UEZ2_9DEIO